MSRLFAILFGLMLLFFFFSCKKEKINLSFFKELSPPSAYDLSSIWFKDSLHGTVCGGESWYHGFIASTSNGGNSWKTDTITNKKIECVQFDSTGQGYACGLDGLLLYRKPEVDKWEIFRTDFCWYRACFFPNPKYGVTVSGEGWKAGIIRQYNPEFWQQSVSLEFTNELNAVCFSDSTTAHAVGMGQVLRSDDKGQTWQKMPPTNDHFLAAYFPTPTIGYIIGLNGTILKTIDNGQKWQILDVKQGAWGKNNQLRSVWFSSTSVGYIVGDAGLFWKTSDGGESWLVINNVEEDIDFTDIFMVGEKGWVSAKGGRFFEFKE
jgi:photosystem II stability/assembly factor-like uncharacterized protein